MYRNSTSTGTASHSGGGKKGGVQLQYEFHDQDAVPIVDFEAAMLVLEGGRTPMTARAARF